MSSNNESKPTEPSSAATASAASTQPQQPQQRRSLLELAKDKRQQFSDRAHDAVQQKKDTVTEKVIDLKQQGSEMMENRRIVQAHRRAELRYEYRMETMLTGATVVLVASERMNMPRYFTAAAMAATLGGIFYGTQKPAPLPPKVVAADTAAKASSSQE